MEYGVTDKKARHLLTQVGIEPSWEEEKGDTTIHLGIDEHSFRGRDLVITVTNLGRRRLKGILRDDRQQTLRQYVQDIPKDVVERVSEVCIDMKELFRRVIEEELPHAQIVVDHFHIIQDANRRLSEARGIEREAYKNKHFLGKRWWFLMGRERLPKKTRIQLDALLIRYPGLRDYYYFKEQLRSMYQCKNREEAAVFLSRIISNMECSDDAAIYQWSKTLRRWRNYILNYFNHKTTNAYTEGAHNKIKMIKRMSFGFKNIDIYIRKMMLAFIPLAYLWIQNYPTIC